MPTDLSLVPLNDLVDEIVARYPTVFLAAHAPMTTRDVQSMARITGDPFLLLGLLHVHVQRLTDLTRELLDDSVPNGD